MDNLERAPCVQMDGCAMYGLFKLSGTLAVWQTNYCRGDYESCARFQLSARGESVPVNLLPNGTSLRK